MNKPFWEDAWPSRIGTDGIKVPRIWKDPRKPDPDKDYTFERWDGVKLSLVDENGNWRWPWWYRIPGWCACYTDTWESALAIVNRYHGETWIMKTFPGARTGHSHVGYPWCEPLLPGGYKPPGVYC